MDKVTITWNGQPILDEIKNLKYDPSKITSLEKLEGKAVSKPETVEISLTYDLPKTNYEFKFFGLAYFDQDSDCWRPSVKILIDGKFHKHFIILEKCDSYEHARERSLYYAGEEYEAYKHKLAEFGIIITPEDGDNG